MTIINDLSDFVNSQQYRLSKLAVNVRIPRMSQNITTRSLVSCVLKNVIFKSFILHFPFLIRHTILLSMFGIQYVELYNAMLLQSVFFTQTIFALTGFFSNHNAKKINL
mgnify:CR=1 FL=1